MATRTIKGLDNKECKILKHIVIIADRQFGESIIGNIFYKRNLSEKYNLLKQKEEDDKNGEDRILRLLKDYPKQENYPKDRIDEIIFESIKDIYPKSILRSELIIFNTDLERLETHKNKNKINSKIYFTPKIQDYSNIYQFVGKSFDSPEIELNIFSDYNNEIRKGQSFSASYFIEEENLLNELILVEFE
ncbi:hypothetical protein G1K75_12760 [Tenacibaculum finnmarkense]|uniref:hypothetical protein n=1 Tax=Tenacibaculum finnmarkense TaxID=2781243 RepID=UPI00187B2377|nr:hypothetical protein [Tenacibaculum finnmarkense]MBE7693732.1 hypothetical protein [Tenacibaculum finnmarkense genomovar finnmarkense]MCG8806523.1 hypothetical protein [Tenacibaculum finnmarkense]MCG8857665.1 hypothetical protein [Tenacibaculum finnmarkense]